MTLEHKIAAILEELFPNDVYPGNRGASALQLIAEVKKRGLYINEARNDPSGRWK